MTRRGPLITLLVAVVLAGVLLAVDLSRAASPVGAAADAQGPSSAAPPSAAGAGPSPAAPAAAAPDPGAPVGGAQEQFPARAKYTGYTDGNHAAIAVSVRDGKASAYLCDGKSVEGWYQGSALNGTVAAKGRGANELIGALSGTQLTGTVSAGGRSWSYTATPSLSPAGLYRSKTATGTTGWIKDSAGNVTGLTNAGGIPQPAPPLDPATAQAVEGGDRVSGQ
jgi:hypothetical protein